MVRWCVARRRPILWIALLVAFFFFLGYVTPRTSLPGTCLIYG